MKPIVIDSDTGRELWRGQQCAEHCEVTPTTWRSYVRKDMPPPVVAHLDDRTPLWDAEDIRVWHAGRPSQSR